MRNDITKKEKNNSKNLPQQGSKKKAKENIEESQKDLFMAYCHELGKLRSILTVNGKGKYIGNGSVLLPYLPVLCLSKAVLFELTGKRKTNGSIGQKLFMCKGNDFKRMMKCHKDKTAIIDDPVVEIPVGTVIMNSACEIQEVDLLECQYRLTGTEWLTGHIVCIVNKKPDIRFVWHQSQGYVVLNNIGIMRFNSK